MKKFFNVVLVLVLTLSFVVTNVFAADEGKGKGKGQGKGQGQCVDKEKAGFTPIELTGKVVKEGKKDIFVAEDGQKYFILKNRGKSPILNVPDYLNKTFKIKGYVKQLSEKEKAKKDYYPALTIEECTEVGAANAAQPAQTPATPQQPMVENKPAETKAEQPAQPATPAQPANEQPKAEKSENK